MLPEPRTTAAPRTADALGHRIVVPAGATWAPSVPWEPSEALWRASLPHDVLYRCQGNLTRTPVNVYESFTEPRRTVGRKFADRVFLERMAAEGIPWWKRRGIYYGVRAGGYPIWLEEDEISYA